MTNNRRETAARRLSALAGRLYKNAGVPGAFVTLTEAGLYRLVEDQNSKHEFSTAAGCEYAIRESARQFRRDMRVSDR